MTSPDFLNPWRTALALTGQRTVYGVIPDAAPYFAWSWMEKHRKPACLLVANMRRLHEAVEYIEAFRAAWPDTPIFPLAFPELDTKFHLSIQSDPERYRARAHAQYTLLNQGPSPLPLLITTPWAWLSALHTPSEWLSQCTLLRRGERVDRLQLEEKLLKTGYRKEGLVEDIGTFSVRGFTFDIFSPAHDSPVRLEFFDEELEALRFFHPGSQTSLQETETCAVVPFHPLLLMEKPVSKLLAHLKKTSDEHALPKRYRDEIQTRFERLNMPRGIEGLLSYASEQPSSLRDYLLENTQIFIADPVGCDAEIPVVLASVDQGIEALPEEVRAYSPFADRLALFPDWQHQPGCSDAFVLQTALDHTSENVLVTRTQSLEDIRHRLNPTPALLFDEKVKRLREFLEHASAEGSATYISVSGETQRTRVEHLLTPPPAGVHLIDAQLPRGFRATDAHCNFLSEEDLFGKRKKRAPSRKEANALGVRDLEPGDFVVHLDHGVGRFIGLKHRTFGTFEGEFVVLEYRDNDRLYLPVDRLNLLSKFADKERTHTAIDKLGSGQWEKTKLKARQSATDVAAKLIEHYARRQMTQAPSVPPIDSAYEQFESEFPFEETPDQIQAIDATNTDLSKSQPADRLICGDVGFGKTEVAMRAAFRAAHGGFQVAVLVPTTLLCLQHETTFRQRFKSFPLRIESLSRFQNVKEEKSILAGLAEGTVDIVIGTHRLLSKDVRFQNLGLLIIDEEQRFGVTHKERLRQLREGVHTLTLTATPIPRTLHLSLMGIRELSLMNTPPQDRLSVRTYVCTFEESLLKNAFTSEFSRGGQVFVVTPRVEGIEELASRIREWIPEARIGVAHGQLAEKDLESRMIAFYKKEIDVLISTTIIESGLDVPNANTMIIHHADRFGLGQLYQLRGRIGRSNVRSYCFLTVESMKKISDDAKKRLQVLQNHTDLGSGLTVSHYDMDLRGAGEIIGERQSGHLQSMGTEAYLELLNDAVSELRGLPRQPPEPDIRLKLIALFPEEYIPDVLERMRLYRRLSSAAQIEDIDVLADEISDRFGPLPPPAHEMVLLSKCRWLAKALALSEIVSGPHKIVFRFSEEGLRRHGDLCLHLVRTRPQVYTALPDGRLALYTQQEVSSINDLYQELIRLWDWAASGALPTLR